MSKHTPTVRVIRILELLSKKNALSIDEIIERTKIPYSSVYRILHEFLDCRYMAITKDRKYKLTLHFINSISSSLSSYASLTEISHPSLQKLFYHTKETVHLGVLSETNVLYLDKIASNHLLRMHSYIGYQANIYCTGIGKALLAWLEPEVIDGIIQNISFKKYTDNTITDTKKFLAHLEKIKRQGYSVDNEEHEKYLYCLAVPIFDYRNHPIAAISVSQPIIRFSKEDKEPFLETLWECAEEISLQLQNTDYKACLAGNAPIA